MKDTKVYKLDRFRDFRDLIFLALFNVTQCLTFIHTRSKPPCLRLFPPRPGALPGAAEQDAGDQVEPAAGADHLPLQHRRHVRGLHRQPAQTAGRPGQREDEAGGRAEEHAGSGGGLQEQVSGINS